MQVRDVFINGIGSYVPPTQAVHTAVDQGLLTADVVAELGFTSVAVAGDVPAPEMALRAARDALKDGGVSPGELALLLYVDVWQQGPIAWQPQLYLQHHLVGDEALAIEVKHGCVGMLSALELAARFLRTEDGDKAALVVASDNFGTPLMNRWTSGAGFTVLGDGASAAVLTKKPGLLQLLSFRTAAYSDMEERLRANEPLFPPGITLQHTVDFVESKETFNAKTSASDLGSISINHVQRIIECAKHALAEAGIEARDVRRVVTDNMPKTEAENYLGLMGFSLDQSAWDFGRGIGHCGANDQLLSLHHLLTTGQLSPGDHVMLCGLSPGVIYKSAVVKVLGTGAAEVSKA
ncbi:MAG TPA: ketoacyl-ACP synthase III family protein [Micromonosporaceae bacterium]|nr:ketoacyl-ACP synthase III family protein [Micromonosporaceae bacterium]